MVEGARLEVVYGQKPSGVRIPPSPFFRQQIPSNMNRPTPSGSEDSSGKRTSYVTRSICCRFFYVHAEFHEGYHILKHILRGNIDHQPTLSVHIPRTFPSAGNGRRERGEKDFEALPLLPSNHDKDAESTRSGINHGNGSRAPAYLQIPSICQRASAERSGAGTSVCGHTGHELVVKGG